MSDAPKHKRRIRIGRLTNLGQISEEIARVYRQARNDDLDSTIAYRLATILSLMGKCLEASVIEQRIGALEAVLAGRRPSFKPQVLPFPEQQHAEQRDPPSA